MSIEVLDDLDLVDLSIDLNFVGLHGLLDSLPDLSESCVNACFLDTRVGSILDGFEEIVINWVEGHSKGCIDDSALNLSAEINLAHVIILQNCLISWVWCVVCSAVVDRDTSGESDTTFHWFLWGKGSVIVLQILTDVSQLSSWLDNSLSEPPDLSLNLGGLSQVLNVILHQSLFCFELLVLNPGDFVLLLLIGWVSLELVVRELELDWLLPALYYSEPLIGLSWGVKLLGCEICNNWNVGFGLFSSGWFLLFFVVFLLLFFLLLLCRTVSLILRIAALILLIFPLGLFLLLNIFCLLGWLLFVRLFLLLFFG